MFGFMVWCPWRWNNKVLREILKHKKKKKEKNEGHNLITRLAQWPELKMLQCGFCSVKQPLSIASTTYLLFLHRLHFQTPPNIILLSFPLILPFAIYMYVSLSGKGQAKNMTLVIDRNISIHSLACYGTSYSIALAQL